MQSRFRKPGARAAAIRPFLSRAARRAPFAAGCAAALFSGSYAANALAAADIGTHVVSTGTVAMAVGLLFFLAGTGFGSRARSLRMILLGSAAGVCSAIPVAAAEYGWLVALGASPLAWSLTAILLLGVRAISDRKLDTPAR